MAAPDLPLGYRRALTCLLGIPASDGNLVDVLVNGDQAFPAMLEAVEGATATVDLQTFGQWSGSVGSRFAEALAGRARSGVRVRVLLDALGADGIDGRLVERMAAAGAEVRWFRPLSNWRVTQSTHRGHRRSLTCDGEVAFTGGIGMADRWRGDARDASEWRDTCVRLRGPAVNGLRGAFVDNWAETRLPLFDEAVDPFPGRPHAGASCVLVVRGEAETGWGDMATLVHSLLVLVRRRLRIAAGHFVPDGQTLHLLEAAVGRGVAVELLRPGPHCESRVSQLSSQAQYQRLLEAGVRVWAFQPTVLGARVITVDGEVAVVGPVPFNSRSLTLNDEVAAVIFDPEVVASLDAHFDADVGHAVEIDLAGWSRRDPRQRAAEEALGFLARRV